MDPMRSGPSRPSADEDDPGHPEDRVPVVRGATHASPESTTELPDSSSPYADVSPDKDWGDDGEGPDADQAVWTWLVSTDDSQWSVAERIEYAKTVGRYDIVEALDVRAAADEPAP